VSGEAHKKTQTKAARTEKNRNAKCFRRFVAFFHTARPPYPPAVPTSNPARKSRRTPAFVSFSAPHSPLSSLSICISPRASDTPSSSLLSARQWGCGPLVSREGGVLLPVGRHLGTEQEARPWRPPLVPLRRRRRHDRDGEGEGRWRRWPWASPSALWSARGAHRVRSALLPQWPRHEIRSPPSPSTSSLLSLFLLPLLGLATTRVPTPWGNGPPEATAGASRPPPPHKRLRHPPPPFI
jgi:hypothetical protein